MYLAPALLAANLQSWRKYIEHVGMTGDTVNGSTRSIVAKSWLGRLVAFTLLHEPFHGVHHQRAGLPHSVLPQHVEKLQPKKPGERAPYTSYRYALIELVRCLADPRVGPQWRTLESRLTLCGQIKCFLGAMSALGCESPLYEDKHHQNWRGFARRWNLYLVCTELRAQATTTVTTTKGAFTEYVPGSETLVVRTETNPAPSRYVVTKQTTIVDESGAPVRDRTHFSR